MKTQLEQQANNIEAVLAHHKIQARVTGGTVTPRWVRFEVLPEVSAKISKIKELSEELAVSLNVTGCRVSQRGMTVDVEVSRDDPQPVRLMPLYEQLTNQSVCQGAIPPVTAILGLADDGAPLFIRLPAPDVGHVLVVGMTGVGKTTLLQTMVLSLAMANPPAHIQGKGIVFVLIDSKGHSFCSFGSLFHLARPIVSSIADAVETLKNLVRLMERRQANDHSHVVVVIDNLADLLVKGGKVASQALGSLTQHRHKVDIHVVAATQKTSLDVMSPTLKSCFTVRLVGRVNGVGAARSATGWSNTGAERLIQPGEFIAVAEGRVIRFHAAHVSPAEIQTSLSHIKEN